MLNQRYLQLYQAAVNAVAQVEAALNCCPTNEQIAEGSVHEGTDMLKNFTDNIYAIRETHALIDTLRKTLQTNHKALQTYACALYMEATPEDRDQMTETGKVVGDYATGYPSPKVSVETLKRVKCPELYDRFCKEVLGVTNESLVQSGSIEVHYKYFGDWLTEQLAQGYVQPEVMSEVKQYNEFEFKVTKKKALLS